METKIYLDNIKCHGCANSISSKLKSINIKKHKVIVDEGAIQFEYENDSDVELVLSTMKKMGYTERDQSKFVDSAKSYISCMIGRVKGSDN